jgi:CBS domain-containing membrane protein
MGLFPRGVFPMDRTTAEQRAPGGLAAIRQWIGTFWPAPVLVDTQERVRAFAGAGIGILLAAWLGLLLSDPAGLWLVAPLGASAVLVFAVPASPLAQPWSVIGGNTISAVVGIACVLLIPDQRLAAAVAVTLAIALMFPLRCLHPPGGASALFAVLSHQTGFLFALTPVLFNSVVLVLAGIVYNSLTGRRYPHVQVSPAATGPLLSRFTSSDLDTALAHYNQVLDVSRDDLEELLHHAELAAYHRNLGELRCSDIMSKRPIAVEFGTTLRQAWALLREHRIKALPVIDKSRRLAGIVTVADFMRHVDLDAHDAIGSRLRSLVKLSGLTHSDKPEVVGQIMTRQVRVASHDRHVMELMPLFSDGGHHHIPIIDAENRLVGIITQTDLMRALYKAVRP